MQIWHPNLKVIRSGICYLRHLFTVVFNDPLIEGVVFHLVMVVFLERTKKKNSIL